MSRRSPETKRGRSLCGLPPVRSSFPLVCPRGKGIAASRTHLARFDLLQTSAHVELLAANQCHVVPQIRTVEPFGFGNLAASQSERQRQTLAAGLHRQHLATAHQRVSINATVEQLRLALVGRREDHRRVGRNAFLAVQDAQKRFDGVLPESVRLVDDQTPAARREHFRRKSATSFGVRVAASTSSRPHSLAISSANK